KEELFASNRLMKNAAQLTDDIDSMRNDLQKLHRELYQNVGRYFSFHLKDKLKVPEHLLPKEVVKPDAESENNENSNQKVPKTTDKNAESVPKLKASATPALMKKEKVKKDTTAKKEIAQKDTITTIEIDSLKNNALADSINAPVVELNKDSIAWAKIDSIFHV